MAIMIRIRVTLVRPDSTGSKSGSATLLISIKRFKTKTVILMRKSLNNARVIMKRIKARLSYDLAPEFYINTFLYRIYLYIYLPILYISICLYIHHFIYRHPSILFQFPNLLNLTPQYIHLNISLSPYISSASWRQDKTGDSARLSSFNLYPT